VIKIAIIGLGYWGKKLLKEFNEICDVCYCCTKGNKENIKWLKNHYPKIKYISTFDDLIKQNNLQAVVIATPINTHYLLVKKSLEAGKHVFVEKTMTQNLIQAKTILDIAKKKKKMLFVGHIFLYHPILRQIKKIIQKDPITYIHCTWTKLGTFNENLVLDFVSHFLSILNELLGMPNEIIILESKGFTTKCDLIILEVKYQDNIKGIIEINRLSNYKKRTISISTRKNLFLWDDDTLLKFNRKKLSFEQILESKNTALALECIEFINLIKAKSKDYSNIAKGLKVLSIIEKLM